jgi:hypothetical protein
MIVEVWGGLGAEWIPVGSVQLNEDVVPLQQDPKATLLSPQSGAEQIAVVKSDDPPFRRNSR